MNIAVPIGPSRPRTVALLTATTQMALHDIMQQPNEHHISSFNHEIMHLEENVVRYTGPYAAAPFADAANTLAVRKRSVFLITYPQYVGVIGVDLRPEDLPPDVRARACIYAPKCAPDCEHPSYVPFEMARRSKLPYTRTFVVRVVREFYGLDPRLSNEEADAAARKFTDFANFSIGQFEDERGRWFAHCFRMGHPVLKPFVCLQRFDDIYGLLRIPWMTGALSCPIAERRAMSPTERLAAGIVETEIGGMFILPTRSGSRDKMPLSFLQPAVNIPFTTRKADGRVVCTIHILQKQIDAFSRVLSTVIAHPCQQRKVGMRHAGLLVFSASWLYAELPVTILLLANGVCTDRGLVHGLGAEDNEALPFVQRSVNTLASGDFPVYSSVVMEEGRRRSTTQSFAELTHMYMQCIESIGFGADDIDHELQLIIDEVGPMYAARVAAARHVVTATMRQTVYNTSHPSLAERLATYRKHAAGVLFEHVDGTTNRLILLREMCARVLRVIAGATPDNIDALGSRMHVDAGRVMRHNLMMALRQAVLDSTKEIVNNLKRLAGGIDLTRSSSLASLRGNASFSSSETQLRTSILTGRVQHNNEIYTNITRDSPANTTERLGCMTMVYMRVGADGAEQRNVPVSQRAVNVTHYCYLDPGHTPDGKSVGLTAHRALTATFSVALSESERASLLQFIHTPQIVGDAEPALLAVRYEAASTLLEGEDFGDLEEAASVLRSHMQAATGLPPGVGGPRDRLLALIDRTPCLPVLVDGAPVGFTLRPGDLAAALREWRQRRWARRHVEITYDIDRGAVEVLTGSGRFVRPVYAVAERPTGYAVCLTREIFAATSDPWHRQTRIGLRELYEAGLVVYLGPRESDYAYIAEGPLDPRLARESGAGRVTHMSLTPLAVTGWVIGQLPFPHNTQAPRLTFGAQQEKSFVGSSSAPVGTEPRDDWVLLYPHRPLTATAVHDQSLSRGHARSVNLVVALAPMAYNQEDGSVFARASSERGAGAAINKVREVYEERCGPPGSMLLEGDRVFAHPLDLGDLLPPNVRYAGPRTDRSFMAIGPSGDGLPIIGMHVNTGDVIVGCIAIEKIVNEKTGAVTMRAIDVSIVHRGTCACVLEVQMFDGKTGRVVAVTLGEFCPVEVGSKVVLRDAQKGVVAKLEDPQRNSYIVSHDVRLHGMPIDIYLNPHSQPSRMTTDNLIQIVASFAALETARVIQGTGFAGQNYTITSVRRRRPLPSAVVPGAVDYDGVEYIDWDDVDVSARSAFADIHAAGVTPFGLHMLANATTGLPLGEPGRPTLHFIGVAAYGITHHRATHKAHAITRATRDNMGLVLGGRSNDGGLRFGAMENDCFVTHGAASMLRAVTCTNSDGVDCYLCRTCGKLAYMHARTRELHCTFCRNNGSVPDVVRVVMPAAARLLTQECMALGISMHARFDAPRKVLYGDADAAHDDDAPPTAAAADEHEAEERAAATAASMDADYADDHSVCDMDDDDDGDE